jgi:type IV secretory pathway protease TraF
MPDTPAVMKRIRALPPERIAEVEDFVAFIAALEQDRALTRATAAASVPAFAVVWSIRKTTSTMPYEFGDVVLVPFPRR